MLAWLHHKPWWFGILACFLVACGALACKPTKPVDLPASPVACVQCQMTIVDLRFAAQAHTRKGRVLFFDSVECVLRYVSEHRDQISRVYFHSFVDPPQWIVDTESRVVRWRGIRSPMGGNLAAFPSEQQARMWLESMGASAGEFDIYRWNELSSLK